MKWVLRTGKNGDGYWKNKANGRFIKAYGA